MDTTFRNCPVNEAYLFTSPLVSIDYFKEQCGANINSEDIHAKVDLDDPQVSDHDELARLLKTDTQTITELEDVCNVDNLKCDYEDRFDYSQLRVFQEFPDDNELQTVKHVKKSKAKMEEIYYVPTFPETISENIKEDDELVPKDEVLLIVSVFHPEKRKVQQEFKVLSNQKLTDLRDMIVCRSDNVILGEYSSNPDLSGAKAAKEVTQSAFFFIEQCFYNDTRNPLNRDYSRIIIDWAKESEKYAVPGLGLFHSAKMQNTSFKGLNLRLGYPYLYCHQGNCEHIIVFTDMRLITPDDPQKVESYPKDQLVLLPRHKKCSVCNIHLIKWMTVNDVLAFEDPSFFCETCFRYLHYSKDGKKLASFEAYPYVGADL